MPRVRVLDGFRGLAIVLVLVGHFLPLPGINLGRLGVELFFVLSGRLMAEILFERGARLGPFFQRRFARVYPTLLVFSTTLWLAATLARQPAPTAPQFWASLESIDTGYAAVAAS